MTRMVWSAVGDRLFEMGVDRGVLYIDGEGVPWNGLVSVEESSSGGQSRSYYIDGVKYLNLPGREEFEATINAFYSPQEFDQCDGLGAVAPGLFAAQQRRKSFGFSYRTKIGNDVKGTAYGYKIHIIYNALAEPSQRRNGTESDEPDVPVLSWSLTTLPVPIPGMMRSSHLVIDTTLAPAYSVGLLEDILYGNDLNAPRLPDPAEVAGLFEDDTEFTVTDLGDEEFEIDGSDIAVLLISPGVYQITADTVVAIDEGSAQISS